MFRSLVLIKREVNHYTRWRSSVGPVHGRRSCTRARGIWMCWSCCCARGNSAEVRIAPRQYRTRGVMKSVRFCFSRSNLCTVQPPSSSRGKNKKKTLAFERYRPTERLGDERVVASVRSATIWSQIQLWLIKFESIAIEGNARIRWYWVSRSPDCLRLFCGFLEVSKCHRTTVSKHRSSSRGLHCVSCCCCWVWAPSQVELICSRRVWCALQSFVSFLCHCRRLCYWSGCVQKADYDKQAELSVSNWSQLVAFN